MSREQPRQIFIGNLSYEATPDDLAGAILDLGIRIEVPARVATFPDTGKPRGFGFITLDKDEPQTVEDVIETINACSVDLYGRVIRADKTRSRPPRPSPGGRYERKPEKPRGGRGKHRDEFRRGRNEFEE